MVCYKMVAQTCDSCHLKTLNHLAFRISTALSNFFDIEVHDSELA